MERSQPVPVETNVFDGAPENALFWVGQTSAPNRVLMPGEDAASRSLYTNTYIGEAGILGDGCRGEDGLEEDQECHRASRFAVIKRGVGGEPDQVIATMLNVWRSYNDPLQLPIEELFPDKFGDVSITKGTCEISRTASRYHDGLVQHLAFLALIRASYAHSAELGSPVIYCAVELFLRDLIEGIGIPREELSEPRSFQEYRKVETVRIPLLFNVSLIKQMGEDGSNALISQYLEGIDTHMGLGLFSSDLVKPL